MGLQGPRLPGGVLDMQVAEEELDSCGQARFPASECSGGKRKCLRKLIRSHETTCGQGPGLK